MRNLELLQIDLTEECPLFCSHCSNSSGPAKKRQFPLEELHRLIEEAGILRVKSLVFSGGEPLRYRFLAEALSFAQSAGLPLTMFTTGIHDLGTRLPIGREEWTKMRSMGLSRAAFSVYSSYCNRDVHNRIVQLKPMLGDAFGVNEKAINGAREAGVEVHIHFIPSDASINELQSIYDWSADLGASVLHLQMPTFQGRNLAMQCVAVRDNNAAILERAVRNLLPSFRNTELHVSRLWRQKWGWAYPLDEELMHQIIVRTDGAVSVCNACKYIGDESKRNNFVTSGMSLSAIWAQNIEDSRQHNCMEVGHNSGAAATVAGSQGVQLMPANVHFSKGTQ